MLSISLPSLLTCALLAAVDPMLHAPDTNVHGTRGLWEVDTALQLPKQTFVITLSGSLDAQAHAFVSGDSYRFEQGTLSLLWAPTDGWDIGLRGSLSATTYRSYYTHTLQQLGHLGAHAKYISEPYSTDAAWRWGVSADLMVPDALQSSSLVFPAARVEIRALTTYSPRPWLGLTANLGAVADGAHTLTGAALSPEEAVFRGVTAPTYSGTLGLGAAAYLHSLPGVQLNPALEVTGAIGHNVPVTHNPLNLTALVRGSLHAADFVQLGIGGTVRLAGVFNGQGIAQQTPPWAAFATLSLHFFEHKGETVVRGCEADRDCPTGGVCQAGVCVVEIKTEIIKTEVQATLTVQGMVLDAATDSPISDAVVVIRGFDATPISVNRTNGTFASFPIPVGPEPLVLVAKAPGYLPATLHATRDKGADRTKLIARLQHSAAYGTLKGFFRDAKTGAPLQGEVHMLATQEKITGQPDGSFSGRIPAGHVDVLFSADGFATQGTAFTVEDGDTLVVDVEMHKLGGQKEQHIKPTPAKEAIPAGKPKRR